MADVPMEIDCPSRGAYMTTSNDECPRKRRSMPMTSSMQLHGICMQADFIYM